MRPIRTVLAHRSSVLRNELTAFLEKAGISNVTPASSLPELLEKAIHDRPDLIVLDIGLVGGDFRRLSERLRMELHQVKLVLTGPEPEAYYARHLAATGVDLYLSDGLQPNEWIRRLQIVALE
jgi:DNA-binding NarL/FixJ family response regulator